MIDLTELNIDRFEVKFKDCNGKTVVLDLSEPKMKYVKSLESIKGTGTEKMTELLYIILKGNVQGVEISNEYIEESFTYSQAAEIVKNYLSWIYGVKRNPNS